MADDTNEAGKPKIPQNNVVLQGRLAQDPAVHNDKFATMRIAVDNSYRREDGTWDNTRPATFLNLKVNGEAQVGLIKAAMEAGKAKKGGHLRFEGFPSENEYQGNKTIEVVARKGQTAFSFDEPEAGKGKANDFTISGTVGTVKLVEGEKNGKPYKFYNLSIADNDRDGKATWYNVVASAPKAVAAIDKGIENGSFGVGALITVKGSMEPNQWEQDGQKRERLELKVKPFDDSLTVVYPAKAKGEAAKTAEAGAAEAGAAEAEAPKKSRGKKAAAAEGETKSKSKRNLDDEIPF